MEKWKKSAIILLATTTAQIAVLGLMRHYIKKNKVTATLCDEKEFTPENMVNCASLDFSSCPEKLGNLALFWTDSDIDKLHTANYQISNVFFSIRRNQQELKYKYNLFIDFDGLKNANLYPKDLMMQIIHSLKLSGVNIEYSIASSSAEFDKFLHPQSQNPTC